MRVSQLLFLLVLLYILIAVTLRLLKYIAVYFYFFCMFIVIECFKNFSSNLSLKGQILV